MTGMKGMSSQTELSSQSQDMPMMDHSNHNMASDTVESATESTEECCNQTCNCFTGGCTSIVALIKDLSSILIIDGPAKIHSVSRLAQSQQPKSLYRPPILS